MDKVQIRITIDGAVHQRLKEQALSEYLGHKGGLSVIVEKALRHYLDDKQTTETTAAESTATESKPVRS